MLKQFIRGEKNQRVGVVVALPNKMKNGFNIGWSIARKDESFDREFLTSVAVGRAVLEIIPPVPHRELNVPEFGRINLVEEAVEVMVQRAKRYYKV